MVCVGARTAAAQAPAYLVKDINLIPNPRASSSPRQFVTIGTATFFSATLADRGGLWRTEGTAESTALVKDVGADVSNLIDVGGTLFFTTPAYDAADGLWSNGLWTSDGTTAGTTFVKEIVPTSNWLHDFINLNGILLFGVSSDQTGAALWRSDGTASGTELIQQFSPNISARYSFGSGIANGALLFFGTDPSHGPELWRSDGTGPGTMLVKDIRPGPQGSVFALAGCGAALNGEFFFAADDGVNGCALWESDGTEANTTRLTNLGAVLRCGTCPINVGDSLFFTLEDQNGSQLWRTDGTAAGTGVLEEVPIGPIGPSDRQLTAVGPTLFFAGYDGASGIELWKSDGTPAGTQRVRDINPGPASSNPTHLVDVDGILFFTAFDASAFGVPTDQELWKSDGTEAGTVRVKDINPGEQGSGPAGLANANGLLLFSADDGQVGDELWRSDGTEAGTVLVKDINAETKSSSPQQLTDMDGTLVFAADDGINGRQLWRSDGTAAGTARMTTVPAGQKVGAGSDPGFPEQLVSLAGTLLFPAEQDTTGEELWSTDGTPGGTRPVKDIAPGPDSSHPGNFLRINQTLFFAAAEPSTGRELWKSDGTASGTVLVKDVAPGPVDSDPGPMASLNGEVLFIARDASGHAGLWASDGTEGGTVLLRSSLSPPALTISGGLCFFTNGPTLWRTDGSAAGTQPLADAPGATGLTDLNGLLLFAAMVPYKGVELWRSDGTPPGTALVKDINPGAGSGLAETSPLAEQAILDGFLFFLADDGVHGLALWKSDGTETGTQLVKALHPGPGAWSFRGLQAVDGALYFITSEPSGVRITLWRSDGTAAGTVPVYNGPGDFSEGFKFAFSGATLFFVPAAATPDSPGNEGELWALPLARLVACSGDCNQNGQVTIDELLAGVNIALDGATIDACPLLDGNGDGSVTIDEILRAVNEALNGCA